MKQLKIIELVLLSTFLLLTPLFSVQNQQQQPNLGITPSIPVLSTEPISTTIPEDFNQSYTNTTNPYSDLISPMSAVDEVAEIEANHPCYVLVAGDEEERGIWRSLGRGPPLDWKRWTTLQIERGDEALVAHFGIDLRILGFIEWDSDDSLTTMTKLWYDLRSKTSQYLGQVYSGKYWRNYVDAIIGITAQATPEAGVAELGGCIAVVRWQVYWADDNVVQHEISHFFHADDHHVSHHTVCCAMEYDTHYHYYIWEDGLWIVLDNIPCAYTAYSWCDEPPINSYPRRCLSLINQHKSKFKGDIPILLGWRIPYETRPWIIYYYYIEDEGRILQVVKCPTTSATIK